MGQYMNIRNHIFMLADSNWRTEENQNDEKGMKLKWAQQSLTEEFNQWTKTDLSSRNFPPPPLCISLLYFRLQTLKKAPFHIRVLLLSPGFVQWPCLSTCWLSLCDSNELDRPALSYYANTWVTKHKNTLSVIVYFYYFSLYFHYVYCCHFYCSYWDLYISMDAVNEDRFLYLMSIWRKCISVWLFPPSIIPGT